jgi:flagellar biogenesis protein FliO
VDDSGLGNRILFRQDEPLTASPGRRQNNNMSAILGGLTVIIAFIAFMTWLFRNWK